VCSLCLPSVVLLPSSFFLDGVNVWNVLGGFAACCKELKFFHIDNPKETENAVYLEEEGEVIRQNNKSAQTMITFLCIVVMFLPPLLSQHQLLSRVEGAA
jgi:hypothetical protein